MWNTKQFTKLPPLLISLCLCVYFSLSVTHSLISLSVSFTHIHTKTPLIFSAFFFFLTTQVKMKLEESLQKRSWRQITISIVCNNSIYIILKFLVIHILNLFEIANTMYNKCFVSLAFTNLIEKDLWNRY
jgi:hypothetical protein